MFPRHRHRDRPMQSNGNPYIKPIALCSLDGPSISSASHQNVSIKLLHKSLKSDTQMYFPNRAIPSAGIKPNVKIVSKRIAYFMLFAGRMRGVKKKWIWPGLRVWDIVYVERRTGPFKCWSTIYLFICIRMRAAIAHDAISAGLISKCHAVWNLFAVVN